MWFVAGDFNVLQICCDTMGNDKKEEKQVKTWICSVCGYKHVGTEPPKKCPVCGVDAMYFDPVEG